MTLNIVHKSSIATSGGSATAPVAADVEYGEIAVNYATADPALFAKDSTNNIVRLNEGPGTVTSSKIAASAVTQGKIASNAVTNGKLANDSVGTAEIQDDAVTTAKIADANVTTAKLADANVTTAKLANASVTPAKLSETYRLATAGNILQVVYGTTGTSVSNTNTTYVDTTLTASITPTSASSKILILVNQTYFSSNASAPYCYNGLRVLRDSTVIYIPNGDEAPATVGDYDWGLSVISGNSASASSYGRGSITLLDSPNTTSATTYKTQGRSYAVSTVTYQKAEAISTITLMEVAA